MIDIIILLACTLCGFACGKYVEKRIKRKGEFYADLTRYVLLLKTNVDGRKLEISEFNKEYLSQSGQIFGNFLVNRRIACSLNSTQKNNVTKFFDNLSCASSDELRKHIDYYSDIFNSEAKQVVDSEVANASVYAKLGILLGMIVGIVLM